MTIPNKRVSYTDIPDKIKLFFVDIMNDINFNHVEVYKDDDEDNGYIVTIGERIARFIVPLDSQSITIQIPIGFVNDKRVYTTIYQLITDSDNEHFINVYENEANEIFKLLSEIIVKPNIELQFYKTPIDAYVHSNRDYEQTRQLTIHLSPDEFKIFEALEHDTGYPFITRGFFGPFISLRFMALYKKAVEHKINQQYQPLNDKTLPDRRRFDSPNVRRKYLTTLTEKINSLIDEKQKPHVETVEEQKTVTTDESVKEMNHDDEEEKFMSHGDYKFPKGVCKSGAENIKHQILKHVNIQIKTVFGVEKLMWYLYSDEASKVYIRGMDYDTGVVDVIIDKKIIINIYYDLEDDTYHIRYADPKHKDFFYQLAVIRVKDNDSDIGWVNFINNIDDVSVSDSVIEHVRGIISSSESLFPIHTLQRLKAFDELMNLLGILQNRVADINYQVDEDDDCDDDDECDCYECDCDECDCDEDDD